jgi:hypothetical protein
MKILKEVGRREKGGRGNEIHAQCVCGYHDLTTVKSYFKASFQGQTTPS